MFDKLKEARERIRKANIELEDAKHALYMLQREAKDLIGVKAHDCAQDGHKMKTKKKSLWMGCMRGRDTNVCSECGHTEPVDYWCS